MAWVAPSTYSVSQVVTAATLNQDIRDNSLYLLARPNGFSKLTGGAYTTTSGSFVDIDATNLSKTITMAGTKVLVAFFGNVSNAGASTGYFDVAVDGTRYGGTQGLVNVLYGSFANDKVSFAIIITVTAGTHTFKMQWMTTGGTLQLTSTTVTPVFFGVQEVA